MQIEKQKGSFMIEFLVSLAIFSIALVGLVKLQNRTLQETGDIGNDSSFGILIEDFTDRYNLSSGDVSGTSKTEIQATAAAFNKDVSVNGNTITIKDKVTGDTISKSITKDKE